MAQWWDAPFFQVALPIVLAQFLGFVWQNKRIDELNRRLDDFNKRFDDFNKRFDDLRSEFNYRFDQLERRLDRIEDLLVRHDRDIAALKERTGIVRVD